MSMRIVPRDYQVWAINALMKYFGTHAEGNPLIVMPTGTGKAVVIAMLMELIYSLWPNQRVLISTHVQELVEQNYKKLLSMWPQAPAGVYAAGLNRRDTQHRIIFNSIQSIAKRAGELFGHVDLLVIDEAHLVSPEQETSYQKVIMMLKMINPKLRVIGLTATPWRLGHGSLIENHIFTDICFDCSSYEAFNWFLEQGYLLPPVPGSIETKIDIDGVQKRGGEFIPGQLQTAVDKKELTEHICREIVEHGHNRKSWLVFASGVDHAEHMAECFNYLGIPTIAIHSKMKGDREKALQAYIAGEYRCAVNNNVLTTGFDHPGLDLIGMARPTDSTVLWVQMLGRGTRPLYAPGFDLSSQEGRLAAIAASPKQNTLVLDFARNTSRLGPINDPVIPRKKGQGGGEAPVKECPQCHTTNHASARICKSIRADGTECGYVFPIATKLHLQASTDALVKTNLPQIETFRVDHITYARHEKNGIAMAKITYYCQKRAFNEFFCCEHPNLTDGSGRENFAKVKARQWWKGRCKDAFPETVAEFLELAPLIPPTTHLRVWLNKKYPEILATDTTGTAFGNEPKRQDVPMVDVAAFSHPAYHMLEKAREEGKVLSVQPARSGSEWDEIDDDIPF